MTDTPNIRETAATSNAPAPTRHQELRQKAPLIAVLAMTLAWAVYVAYGRYGGPPDSSLARFGQNAVAFGFAGSLAVGLLWFQVMIGSNLRWLRSRVRGLDAWHKRNGIFTLAFALAHPLLLVTGLAPAALMSLAFIPEGRLLAVLAGDLTLITLLATVVTALLMRRPWFALHWRKIHYLNYVAFASAWLHGWFLGVAPYSSAGKALYAFYALTVTCSLAARLYRDLKPKA